MTTAALPRELREQLSVVFERLTALLDAVDREGVALGDDEQEQLRFARDEINGLLVGATR
jgi:hypothetical protein